MTYATTISGRRARIVRQLLAAVIATAATTVFGYLLLHPQPTGGSPPLHRPLPAVTAPR